MNSLAYQAKWLDPPTPTISWPVRQALGGALFELVLQLKYGANAAWAQQHVLSIPRHAAAMEEAKKQAGSTAPYDDWLTITRVT